MRRREFIRFIVSVAVSSLAPPTARAQRADKPPVIGLLVPGASPSVFRPTADLVERRLGELGWLEGRNVIVEYRYAEGSLERAAEIAAEFVRMKVDVIMTAGDTQVLAVKRATSAIPIVMMGVGDAVGNGLVASLARPGGNVTGISSAVNETAGKRVELLRDVVPGLRRVAVLGHFANSLVGAERDAVLAAAHTLGLDTVQSAFRTEDDVVPAIESLKGRAEALYVCFDPLVYTYAARINATALAMRLPVMHLIGFLTEAGGLLSYGPDVLDEFRRAVELADKILRGAKPADIPVEQPTKYDLVVNLKTAKTLGLTIPETFLARADKVIE